MKYLFLLAKAFFILCVPVLLLTTTLRIAVSTPALYRYSFQKYDVSDYTGISYQDLRHVADDLAQYFNSDRVGWDVTVTRDDRQVQLLSDLEMEHFRDVKALVRFDYGVQVASLAYALAFALGVALSGRRARSSPWFHGSWREIASGVKWGAALMLASIILLGLGGLVLGFDQLFLSFHLTFFNNDLWIARPGAIMTTLFQEDFFRDAALFIAGTTVVEALVLAGIGWQFSKKPEGDRGTSAPGSLAGRYLV